jgi:hypothetical protein
MDAQNIYAVALLAIKPASTYNMATNKETGRVTFWPVVDETTDAMPGPEFLLVADSTLATSEEEAKEICLRRLREKFPEADGWTGYIAKTCMTDLGPVAQALKQHLTYGVKGDPTSAEPKEENVSDDVLDADELL